MNYLEAMQAAIQNLMTAHDACDCQNCWNAQEVLDNTCPYCRFALHAAMAIDAFLERHTKEDTYEPSETVT